MSLKINTIANLFGQSYAVLIGIVVLPIYLEFLGGEAYGLIGFYTLLQTWLSLLTAGVGPTFAREVAKSRGLGELWKRPFRELVRGIEVVVGALSILTAVLIWFASSYIATDWLDGGGGVSNQTLTSSIRIMGLIVALRWSITLYVSGMGGMERQVWVASFNSTMTTVRYGIGYIQLRWFTTDVYEYFLMQLALVLIELVISAKFFYNTQSGSKEVSNISLVSAINAVKKLMPFFLGIAYTSAAWVMVTQVDKLILSHTLPLKEFGYFSIVILVANGILQFAAPVSQAILPRMVFYKAQINEVAVVDLYKRSTQLIAVVSFAIAGVALLYSEMLIYVLTNKMEAAEWGKSILVWFVIGNCLLVITGLQYNLQIAHGDLKLHMANSTINIIVQVPILAYMALKQGPLAVAETWLGIRLLIFVAYPFFVHRKFVPGLHWAWVKHDIGLPLIGSMFGALLCWIFFPPETVLILEKTRIEMILIIISAGFLILVTSSLFSGCIRGMVSNAFRKIHTT